MTTAEWAEQHGLPVDSVPPAVPDYVEPCPRTAREIAARCLVLQGVIAVAAECNPEPISDWLREQGLWDAVTPAEKAYIHAEEWTEEEDRRMAWHKEALWTLLWVIGKIEALGLPTIQCDAARIVDEIMPALGDDVEPFLASARSVLPGQLLAEDDRTYNMWCYTHVDPMAGKPLPDDLIVTVLYERRYAFEWLDGIQEWDEVICDA